MDCGISGAQMPRLASLIVKLGTFCYNIQIICLRNFLHGYAYFFKMFRLITPKRGIEIHYSVFPIKCLISPVFMGHIP